MEENKKSEELRYEKYPNDMVQLDITEDEEYHLVLINKELGIGIELKTKDKKFMRYLRRTINAVLEKDDRDIGRSYI